jgi:phosphoribosyl 1,2-cyclic phosphodiesterase
MDFTVLASGSKGNCAVVRSGMAGLLIDLGLGPRSATERMAQVGMTWEQITAALLTHTHGDHVGEHALGRLARCAIPLYCHEGHRTELAAFAGFRKLDAKGLVRHYDDRPFLSPSGVRVEPVELRHDAGPTFGFRIECRAERRGPQGSLGYVADTGCWWQAVADGLVDVDVLAIEFNHDVEMQRRSGRPPYLIERNLGDDGHLSNDQGAALLDAVVRASARSRVRQVVLLHLSEQCNRPDLALAAASAALRQAGRRAAVHAASQRDPHPHLPLTRRSKPSTIRPSSAAAPWEAA